MPYLINHHWQLVREKTQEEAPTLRTPEDAMRLVRNRIAEEPTEHFIVIPMNTRNRVISIETISLGSLNGSLVHPREVFRIAIAANAAGIILAHNHPSGDPTPSREDLELTRRLKEAGKVIGIEVLDHVITGPNGHTMSFRDKNFIS